MHVARLTFMLGLVLAPAMAHAQGAWPERSITLVVPYAAGGYTDLVGRLTARYLEKNLGKPVVVENRAGAGGIVGTLAVAKAAPDGHTFCVCSVGAISVAPFAQKTGYDPMTDLAPIGIVSTIVQAVIVKKALPINSMAELVVYAKGNPGKLNYGSSGIGGLTHYSVELFQARTGTKMMHIPFKGGAPATAALVSGDIDLSFANMTDALPQIEAGTVRGLAVTSLGRSPYFPNIPSVHETVSPHFIFHCRDLERDHRTAQNARADHRQDGRTSDQDGRRPGCQGSDAKSRRQHREVEAERIPRTDQAGNGTVETADRGDRG